jgi:hypothetical protein
MVNGPSSHKGAQLQSAQTDTGMSPKFKAVETCAKVEKSIRSKNSTNVAESWTTTVGTIVVVETRKRAQSIKLEQAI